MKSNIVCRQLLWSSFLIDMDSMPSFLFQPLRVCWSNAIFFAVMFWIFCIFFVLVLWSLCCVFSLIIGSIPVLLWKSSPLGMISSWLPIVLVLVCLVYHPHLFLIDPAVCASTYCNAFPPFSFSLLFYAGVYPQIFAISAHNLPNYFLCFTCWFGYWFCFFCNILVAVFFHEQWISYYCLPLDPCSPALGPLPLNHDNDLSTQHFRQALLKHN